AGPVAEDGSGAAAAPSSGAFRQARRSAEGEDDRRQGRHPSGAVTGPTPAGSAARGRKLPIPLTLITGFLGAGKTTLLNRLVREPALAGTAVIINEFGEVGIDHLLVEHAEEGIIELSAGCVCCTIRGELVEALERLLRAVDNRRVATIG